ncbi:hypothetical protein BGX24_011280, partial [Mortierella sp. AD032]
MRSAILLLATAVLVAVQAAPISNRADPEAASVNAIPPGKCFKVGNKWECYGVGLVEPEASAEPKAASVNAIPP